MNNNKQLPLFREIEAAETSYPEAHKYESLGLRSEMNQYMAEQARVETYALSAAAIVFTYSLKDIGPSNTPAEAAVFVFLSIVSWLILLVGYERLRFLRYRITRLGMYTFLKESEYPNREGWEHFVYKFREVDMVKLEERLRAALEIENWKARSIELNKIAREIDDKPGKYTENIYVRWMLIGLFATAACVIRSVYAIVSIAPSALD